MLIEQRAWNVNDGWKIISENDLSEQANLVLVFSGRFLLEEKKHFDQIKSFYPNADILLNSTSGEIAGTSVFDDSIVITAVAFEKTKLVSVKLNINEVEDSLSAGKTIAGMLDKNKLSHVFIISDGQKVNGSKLVEGVMNNLPDNIALTGGLAGDGGRFEKTLVGLNDYPEEGLIAAIGFYGENLRIGYGSRGGWDPFGPKRLITKSKGNELFELDGQSALKLYKTYLGDKAEGLPGSALLFPLSIETVQDTEPIVRTVLSINEENQSMIFAGDMPEGAYARLMKANFDRLIDGAYTAANVSSRESNNENPQLGILISCVGRKLVLNQRIEEEVEAVKDIFGENTVITGFYSYGEISPFTPAVKCELHNQTMTITTFSEI